MRGLRRHSLIAVVSIGVGALALAGLLGGLILSGVPSKTSALREQIPLIE